MKVTYETATGAHQRRDDPACWRPDDTRDSLRAGTNVKHDVRATANNVVTRSANEPERIAVHTKGQPGFLWLRSVRPSTSAWS